MLNVYHPLNRIQNHPEVKPKGNPVRGYLGWLIEVEWVTLIVGDTTP